MPWRRALAAMAVGAVTVACGSGSQAARPSPTPVIASPSTAPTSSPTPGPCAASLAPGSSPLIVVLESRRAGARASVVRPLAAHDSVAIIGLDAVARARTDFQPRLAPYVGNAAPLLAPHEAYVVNGAVYYIDGFGTVWSMGADGKPVTVARFPIGVSQQEVSFAVSPDGCHFAAARLTIPPKGPGDPLPSLNGTWKLETMVSDAGGNAQVLHTWTSTEYPGGPGAFHNLTVVGWDSTGPVVVVDAPLGTQATSLIDNPDFFGGSLAHLDAGGMPSMPIAVNGCTPLQVAANGDITCINPSTSGQSVAVSVLSSAGAVEVPAFSVNGFPDVAVGPNGEVAATGQWRSGGSSGTLPANFQPEGWIDPITIFGRIGDPSKGSGDAALAHIGPATATIEDLRFVGDYVGVLS